MDIIKLDIIKERLILKKLAKELGKKWQLFKKFKELKIPEYVFVENITNRHTAKKSYDLKKGTQYFIEYSDSLLVFYSDLSEKYLLQNKKNLSSDLTWLTDNVSIKLDEICCAYCGVPERVLSGLFINGFKTKRGRGAWFEIDRMDAQGENNVYTKDNMVLCCYFCNNHKSDVISVIDMRKYFGKYMFEFLMDKYNEVVVNKQTNL